MHIRYAAAVAIVLTLARLFIKDQKKGLTDNALKVIVFLLAWMSKV